MTRAATRNLILWLTLFAGPAFWLLSFQAKFSWTQWACSSQNKLALFIFALLALALTATAGILARRQYKELGDRQPGEEGSDVARSRFMALGAMVFSAGFCLVIVAQTIPDMVLGACQ
jgi:dipeptide/tripeptide permease